MEHMMHFDIKSKSFRKGFLDGFTPHYVYFRGLEFRRAFKKDTTIRNAWSQVGNALKEAEETERGRVVKENSRAR
jgi:hypothetical protein